MMMSATRAARMASTALATFTRCWATGHIPRTRQILRKLLVGGLECRAFDEGGRVGYRFTGQGSYAELLPAKLFNACGDPGGIRTRDLDLERVASWARLDDGVSDGQYTRPTAARSTVARATAAR